MATATYQRIARDLRPGDTLTLDGLERTIDYVTAGSEVRIDLAGTEFPHYIILWAGDPA